MTLVKICGITHREDALAAIDAGADVLGFIAVQESPRFVSASDFRRIREVLPEGFPAVVVVKRLRDANRYHAPIVQYYEECDSEVELDAGTKLVRVYRVRDAGDVEAAKNPGSGVDAVLLDAGHTVVLGGSGTRFDWDLAADLHGRAAKPFILAGGLTPGNVADAIRRVRPYAVDVSSGVEDKIAGKKCLDLVQKFIGAVREFDSSAGAAAGGCFLE